MIVVDTNVIAHLLLPSPLTETAERLFVRDPGWIAPLLWRSELRNVLVLYMRKGLLSLAQAADIQGEAEAMFAGNEYEAASRDVLELAAGSGCSAYDCEFVALARGLDVKLVTLDRQVLRAFPDTALPLDAPDR